MSDSSEEKPWTLEAEFECYAAVASIEEILYELHDLMGTDIFAAIRGISSGLDAIKKLSEIARSTRNIELQEGIIDLRQQLLDARESLVGAKEEISDLKAKNQALETELEKLKTNSVEKLLFKDGLYYKKNGDGPFCTRCYDSESKTIRVTELPKIMQDVGKYTCPDCNAFYPGK